MASGVATTRLKKLHFTNWWLNQNCEIVPRWRFELQSFAWNEIGAAGIRTIYCGNL